MINISLSQTVEEVTSAPLSWPESTKPWIVATALFEEGERAHLQTTCIHSGLDLISTLVASGWNLVALQCFVIDRGVWRMRQVSEVLAGLLSHATVVVFRDSDGVDFCPDAPTIPANQVSSLISVGSVGSLPAPETPVTVTANVHFYRSAVATLRRHNEDFDRSKTEVRVGQEATSTVWPAKQ